jgi:metal-sulfur cluster biosynthetic enzyme
MTVDQLPDKETILDALRQVEDPELGMDIVELGLLYDIETIDPGTVKVIYSFTTPACPAGPQITGDIVNVIRALPGVVEVVPELVWTPPWTPELMSDDAKFILGIG